METGIDSVDRGRRRSGVKRKIRYPWKASRFWILINTNHEFDDQFRLDLTRAVLREALDNLFTPAVVESYHTIKFNLLPPDETEMDKIERVDGKYGFEIGPATGYLHVHMDVTIRHNSNIHLNSRAIVQYIMDKFNEHGIGEVVRIFVRIKLKKADMVCASGVTSTNHS